MYILEAERAGHCDITRHTASGGRLVPDAQNADVETLDTRYAAETTEGACCMHRCDKGCSTHLIIYIYVHTNLYKSVDTRNGRDIGHSMYHRSQSGKMPMSIRCILERPLSLLKPCTCNCPRTDAKKSCCMHRYDTGCSI